MGSPSQHLLRNRFFHGQTGLALMLSLRIGLDKTDTQIHEIARVVLCLPGNKSWGNYYPTCYLTVLYAVT